MKKSILGVIAAVSVVVTGAGAAQAQVQTTPYGSVRGWTVSAHAENGFFQGCSATLTASTHWMTMEHHPMIGWAVQIGLSALWGTHNGYVDIDRASFDAQFDGNGGQVNFLASDPMMGAIRAGNQMSLSVPNVWQSNVVPLRGTAAAAAKITECVNNEGRAPAAAPAAAPAQASTSAQRGHTSCPGWASFPSQDLGGAAELYLVNATGRALMVYWIDGQGILQEMGPLPANDALLQQTYVGHNFVVRDRDGRCYGGVVSATGARSRIDIH